MFYKELEKSEQEFAQRSTAIMCGVGFRESILYFDGWHKEAEKALDGISWVGATPEPFPSVLISGSLGSGKTGLLSAMLKNYFHSWAQNQEGDVSVLPQFFAKNCQFITEYDLHQALQDAIQDNSDRYEDLKKVKTLLIDDLGAGHQTEFRLAKLEELIHYRYSNQLTTWISSNYTSKEIKSWPGWERIVSRFADKTAYRYFELSGSDRRLEKQSEARRLEKQSEARS